MSDDGSTGQGSSSSDSASDTSAPAQAESALASSDATAATLSTMASSSAGTERAAPSAIFGRYQLEELIGAGGMGVVYRAYDPMLERAVALKIVRVVDGDAEAQRRLFREAQALAQVRHPNVVSVHDVGTLGEDVFVAMELIEGTPLARWQEQRDTGDILQAYLQAGRGLAAAHARGLVHRDVKPQNILVAADGRVTVIDFGLAAVDEETPVPDRPLLASGTEDSEESHPSLRTPLTEFGKVMGTPRYMSPEQHAGGVRVDALSDQFSFAVALYEALAKTWPFVKTDKSRKKLDTLRIAKERGVFAPPARPMSSHLRRTLQRALDSDPGERFPSMDALLEELQKDPARARRRYLAAAAALSCLAAASWFAMARQDERGAALCQGAADELAQTWNPARRSAVKQAFAASGISYAEDAFERVASALDGYGAAWTRMRTDACKATHIHGVQSDSVLDLRMGCLDRKRRSLGALVDVLAGEPDRQVVDKAVEASLKLGGLELCADVKALEQEVEPPERPQDRRTLAELRGQLETVRQLDKVGKYGEAREHLENLAPRVAALGFAPLRAEFAFLEASNLRALGKYAEAEPLIQEALALALQWDMTELAAQAGAEATYLIGYHLQRHSEGLVYGLHTEGLTRGRGDELEAAALATLASVHFGQNQFAKAERLDQRALAIREKSGGAANLDVARSLNSLAGDYYAQGQFEKAASFYERDLAIWEQTLGANHPRVATLLNNLAVVYFAQEKLDQAEELHARAIAIRERALGADHPDVAYSLNNLADLYRTQGHYEKAVALHERALAIREEKLDAAHPDIAVSLHNLADCYFDQKDDETAAGYYERALAIFETALGADHPYVAHPLVGLAETYENRRRFAAALPLLERANSIREKAEVGAEERAEAAFALARVLRAVGKDRSRAIDLARQALALYQTAGRGNEDQSLAASRWLAENR